jgi:hypothetical protein
MKLFSRFGQIPYRTRRLLRRLAIAAGILLAVGLLIWCCWMVWLQRYVIYTRDGAFLDFGMNPTLPTGQPAVKPATPDLEFEYLDEEHTVGTDTELKQLAGYYISAKDLTDIPAVKERLKGLPRGTPVMVEVKNITGNFYYSSTVGETRPSSIDTAAMDELIEYLDKSGLYTIAYLPALRDYQYGLHHVPDGLPTSGGWLWMDSAGCYWLNPSSQGTVSYLVRIISELQNLGFNEVVLYDFYFPDTSSIVFKADKKEALTTAAKTLVTTCATDTFAVSFVCESDFQLPQGRCRMYKKNIAASQVENVAQNSGLETPLSHLVFLTDIHDTRFDAYGVLRPLP